MNTAYRDYLF